MSKLLHSDYITYSFPSSLISLRGFYSSGQSVSISAENNKCSSSDVYLTGAVNHNNSKALHAWTVITVLTLVCLYHEDDAELWNFTLDGIEELDVPAGGPPRELRPSTPSNHHMQTRSKTPQRGASRPPGVLSDSRPPQQYYQGRPGKVSEAVSASVSLFLNSAGLKLIWTFSTFR